MATLDQLSADRRAIIELVLQRGQSYGDLSEALGMPEPRVREHAREALVSLAPRTAERVDPDWRGQVADYVLNQQSGPQAKATRSHLKGSEAARTWALSVMDSVGHLYPRGSEPEVPSGGRESADGEHSRRAPRKPGATAAGAVVAADGATSKEARGARPARRGPDAPAAAGRPMSDEARSVVRRRRIVAAVLAVLAALALLAAVLILAGVFDGGEQPSEGAADPAEADPEVLSQIALEPVGGSNGAGAAIIAQREGQNVLLMQGRLPPPGQGQVYLAWLYNSPNDAVPVAGPQVDRRGNFQALGPLPEDYERYEFLDISVQDRRNRSDQRNHSGKSLLRGPVAGTPELSAPEGGLPAPEGGLPAPEGGLPAPEGGLPAPEGGLPVPEGALPPEGTDLPEPGDLPTTPEGGG